MATLTTQQIDAAGIVPTFDAVTGGGDKVRQDADYVEVLAAGGGSITVTAAGAQACSQGSSHNRAVVVAAGTRRKISLLPKSQFISLSDGLMALTYTGTTAGATIGAFRI